MLFHVSEESTIERFEPRASEYKRKILIGQTADEAQRLLGQPDKTYAGALSHKINLGWFLKDPKHYGLLVYLDERRIVREVKIVD